jgi:hypothetical protein
VTLVQLSMRMNGAVSAILRSPFHWPLSAGLMLITVTGRKTGRVYTIPVGYQEVDGAIVILVGEAPNKVWWRNYVTPAPMGLRVRGKSLEGIAEVLRPESPEFRERAEASLRRAPFMPRVLGVDFDRAGGLTSEQVKDLAARIAIVRVSSIRPS